MKSLIPNELSAKFADPAVKRQLMAEFGDAGPFSGVNEEGEQVLASITPRSIMTRTFQKNGWTRLNWYDEKGFPAGESFDGRWNTSNNACALNTSKAKVVYVVVYNDAECGTVDVDVFEYWTHAVEQVKRNHDEIAPYLVEDQWIKEEHKEGSLVRFAVMIGEDETFYECFLREETIQ